MLMLPNLQQTMQEMTTKCITHRMIFITEDVAITTELVEDNSITEDVVVDADVVRVKEEVKTVEVVDVVVTWFETARKDTVRPVETRVMTRITSCVLIIIID